MCFSRFVSPGLFISFDALRLYLNLFVVCCKLCPCQDVFAVVTDRACKMKMTKWAVDVSCSLESINFIHYSHILQRAIQIVVRSRPQRRRMRRQQQRLIALQSQRWRLAELLAPGSLRFNVLFERIYIKHNIDYFSCVQAMKYTVPSG